MGMQGKCSNCIWYGAEQCDSYTEAELFEDECSYYPVIDMVSDEEAQLLVEEGRKEYYEAYQSYIREGC